MDLRAHTVSDFSPWTIDHTTRREEREDLLK
jgi:hypothetical protein